MLLLKICNSCNNFIIKASLKTNYSHLIKGLNNFSVRYESRRNKSDFSIFTLFRKENIEQLKRRDNLGSSYELIYRNTMEKYLTMGRILSMSSVVLVGLGFVLNGGIEGFDTKPETYSSLPKRNENEKIVYFSVLVMIAVILHSVISRMPVRIYYNSVKKDSYVFVYQTIIPTKKRYIECLRRDIKQLPSVGFMPWSDHMYNIGDRWGNYIIDNFFKAPADMSVMLGYQKP